MAKSTPLTPDLIARKGEAAPAPEAADPPSAKATNRSVTRKSLTVKLDPKRYQRLRRYAFKHETSHQEVLVEALDAFLVQNA